MGQDVSDPSPTGGVTQTKDWRHTGQQLGFYGAALSAQPTAVADGSGGGDISCKAFNSANQSIPNSSNTIVDFDSEDYDTDGMHDLVTNNSRITIQTAGKYLIWFNALWAINATGVRGIRLRRDGSTIISTARIEATSAFEAGHGVMTIEDVTVGTFYEIEVFQSSGGALDLRSGDVPARVAFGAALMSTIDAEARTAINDLLARLRTLGIIAT